VALKLVVARAVEVPPALEVAIVLAIAAVPRVEQLMHLALSEVVVGTAQVREKCVAEPEAWHHQWNDVEVQECYSSSVAAVPTGYDTAVGTASRPARAFRRSGAQNAVLEAIRKALTVVVACFLHDLETLEVRRLQLVAGLREVLLLEVLRQLHAPLEKPWEESYTVCKVYLALEWLPLALCDVKHQVPHHRGYASLLQVLPHRRCFLRLVPELLGFLEESPVVVEKPQAQQRVASATQPPNVAPTSGPPIVVWGSLDWSCCTPVLPCY